MEYMDEKILEIRNQNKKLENKDIYKDVYVCGEKIEFEDVFFFDRKMSMRIPREYTDLPLALAKIKYPAEQRPQIIKANEDGSVNITLSLYEQELKKEDIESARNEIKAIFKKMFPANVFYDTKIEENENIKVGYFDYKSSALDCDLYNVLFLTSIGGNSLLGTFNCKHSDMEEWKLVVPQMIMSIKELTR